MPLFGDRPEASLSIVVLLELGGSAHRAFVLVLLQNTTTHYALRHVHASPEWGRVSG
jgi:hypothetical protein